MRFQGLRSLGLGFCLVAIPMALGCSEALAAQESILCPDVVPAKYSQVNRHAETPPAPYGDISDPNSIPDDVLRAHFGALCFNVRRGLPRKGEADHVLRVSGADLGPARVLPEIGAFNLSVHDLEVAPRIVARVWAKSDVPALHYAAGFNYFWIAIEYCQVADNDHCIPCYAGMSINDCSYRYRVFVLQAGSAPAGAVSRVEVPVTRMNFTEHGTWPLDDSDMRPKFSGSVSRCNREGRRACFVDTKETINMPPGSKRSESTSTWIKMNGVCYCQGDNCH